jgi:hypothetical protein
MTNPVDRRGHNLTDEQDVLGHAADLAGEALLSTDSARRPTVVEDDDVEGHGMIQGGVDPRPLARDHQRDIQAQAEKRSLMDRVRGR